MSSMDQKKQEMTPEEKLLALIQQDKRQGSASATPQDAATTKAAVKPSEPVSAVGKIAGTRPPVVRDVSSSEVSPDSTKSGAEAEPARLAGSVKSAHAEAPQVKKIVSQATESPKAAGVQGDKTLAVGSEGAGKAEHLPLPQSPDAPSFRKGAASSGAPFAAVSRVAGGGMLLLNRVLAVVVLVLLVVVVYSLVSIRTGVADELAKQIAGAGEMPLMPLVSTNEVIPPLDYYLGAVDKRGDLFGSRPTQTQGGTNSPAVLPEKSDLMLMGVSLDAAMPTESMAIIKHKPSSKTYFVKMGEGVGDTGFILQHVLADHVVLKSKKQELELK